MVAIRGFRKKKKKWLQSVERHGQIGKWSKLCDMVMAKYDKDQYQRISQAPVN
jgi:hypothetical protein